MSDRFSMVAKHARGKVARDVIFEAGRRAGEAVKAKGKAAIVNATIGTLLNDQEELAYLPCVYHTLQHLPPEDFAAYSPFTGAPEFLKAMEDMTFGAHRPEAFIASFATPGSTGALRNAFWNYMEEGEEALIPDWHWAAYSTIAIEHQRRVRGYAMFDADRRFHLAGLRHALEQEVATHGRALAVVNDPGHNPTGYDMSAADWDGLLDMVTELARGGARLTIVVDLPYLDYAADPEASRAFMSRLGSLPRNVLFILAASISKSFTLYGLRTGTMIGISSDAGVMQEFVDVNAHSARGVWTNAPRAGMRVVARIWEDAALRRQLLVEREGFRDLLKVRAALFLKECEAAGLPTLPYRSGFFVSIPSRDSAALAQRLWASDIYTVPMELGVRFAISGVATHKLPGVAALLKVARDEIESA